MIYIERKPHPALAPYIKSLWYCLATDFPRQRQIVLPTGHIQIVISLAADHLTDCSAGLHAPSRPQAPTIVAGLYSRYSVIDSTDLAGLIGVVFHPGGTAPFFSTCAHLFTNLETSIEDIWGPSIRSLRDRIREADTAEAKFDCLESEFRGRLTHTRIARNRIVEFSLAQISAAPNVRAIADLARNVGLSPRRLAQLFHEYVGVSPKLYCRIQRFQRAVRLLHQGEDVHWIDLALACGYYDQSHFTNDFRAFSGITPTTYTSAERPWANHLVLY